VDAAQALAELREISTQVDVAVILDEKGAVAGSTHGNPERLADAAQALLERAAHVRDGDLVQLEASAEAGSVFVVRDGGRTIAALTGPEATSGLVFYDLKTALRALDPPKPKRKRAAPKKKKADDAA
jgi:hypothetical protein